MVVGCGLWVVGCWLLVVGCGLFCCLVDCIVYTFNKTTKQPNNKTTILKHCYLIHYRNKTKADDFYGSLRCAP